MEDLKTEIEAALPTSGGGKDAKGEDPYSLPENLEGPGPPAYSLSSTAEPALAQEGAAGSGFSPHASCRPDP